MTRLALHAHPSNPCPWIRSFEAVIEAAPRGALNLRYVLEGDISRLRIPTPKLAQRTDGLWRHTCFEAFLRSPPARAYCELNFAPSGDWAAYAFSDYRLGMTFLESIRPPSILERRTASQWEVQVSLTMPASLRGPWRAAFAAVLEDQSGQLSYWALVHPSEKPDFHHESSFAADLL